MNDVLAAIAARRLLPVVVLDKAADGAPLADALVAGGLPIAEVTFRTPAAEDALRSLGAHPQMLVGAGTVVRADQVSRAVDAGAQFVVSPGLSVAVVRRGQELGVPVIPGIATATELMAALDLGVGLVKFFPSEASGALPALSALAAPFPGVRFVPTGGIGPEQLRAYLAHPAVTAVGGSWMVARTLIAAGDFAEVTRLSADAVRAAA